MHLHFILYHIRDFFKYFFINYGNFLKLIDFENAKEYNITEK